MRIERIDADGSVVWIERRAEQVVAAWPTFEALASGQRPSEACLELVQSAASHRTLPPVAPSKIICVGLNYRQHAAEMGKPLPTEPLLFLKPPSALVGPGEAIVLPPESNEVHYEGELALVIGRTARRVSAEEAAAAIWGLTILNDVTARDIQRAEGQRYTRAKGFDTFAPVGPAVVTGLDPRQLRVRTFVDDELRQDGPCSDLIFDLATIVSFVSRVMTLLPGDLISTGTPSGVGPLSPGQVVRVEIDGIGALGNPVVAGDTAPAGVG